MPLVAVGWVSSSLLVLGTFNGANGAFVCTAGWSLSRVGGLLWWLVLHFKGSGPQPSLNKQLCHCIRKCMSSCLLYIQEAGGPASGGHTRTKASAGAAALCCPATARSVAASATRSHCGRMHQDGTACDMLPGMSMQLIGPAERACLEPPAGVYVVAV